jgi:hypothetical protein
LIGYDLRDQGADTTMLCFVGLVTLRTGSRI